ncbi:putative porin [Thiogranum longum]|uniref:Putative porin n=1 Tax=Thiogranum longum TaxID=1537524 RepID=A0A4R1HD11_9GAMM|nr:porin [Thiogranum longum]TCK19368.1 putative porin [Thiogranum longum]
MNKKLIVTAMGLVLAGGMGLANADVKLYGQLDVSIDSTDVDGGDDDVNMGSNRSAIGVKGSEDLGDGMSAFFKVEWQVDIDDSEQGPGTNEDDTVGRNNSEWKGRDMYVGLKSKGFGKIAFGSMSTAYKSPASKLDPFYRTRNQARNIGLQSSLHKGRGEEGQGRATNTIRYDSPTFAGGAKVFGTYTLDNNKNDANDDDPYSLGASYKAGNIYAFASYLTTQTGGDDDATQFGLKYTFGDVAVWGMYEIDGGLISGDQDANIFDVGASYTIGNNLVSFDYAEGDESDDGVSMDDYTTWRLGGYHKFSNRTRVYATYAQQDFDNTGEIDIFSLGLRHNF